MGAGQLRDRVARRCGVADAGGHQRGRRAALEIERDQRVPPRTLSKLSTAVGITSLKDRGLFACILPRARFMNGARRWPRSMGRRDDRMYRDQKVIVVMPAYNAERTLLQSYREVREQGLADEIILVDDGSRDGTAALARTLEGVRVHVHERNRGYGGNQKSCYRLALDAGAQIVVMIHPDYQYTPKLLPALTSIVGNGVHPCVLGSRILGGYAIRGGMPVWKYVANRILTLIENLLLGAKLSEYHTGYRAFSREVLERVRWEGNSDDFLFDNQILAQILWHGYTIGEVSCPTSYFAEASSIGFARSLRYGLGCLQTAALFRLARWRLARSPLFPQRGADGSPGALG